MHPFLILLAGLAVVVGGILFLRLHAFLALLLGALTVALLTPSAQIERYAIASGAAPEQAMQLATRPAGERVARGFGETVGEIGIMIAMASLIGVCMLESGAADRLVRAGLRLLGINRAPLALAGTSFFLSIPVFFDTVFYLMIPLAKATRLRTGKDYLFYVMAIVAGGTVTHSLVPPTPGPLFVAGAVGADIGLMMLIGCGVGLVAATAAFLFARWRSSHLTLPLRESGESMRQLEEIAGLETRRLPPILLAALPVLLPLVFISTRTIAESQRIDPGDNFLLRLVFFLGEKNLALITAALIALATVAFKKTGAKAVSAISESLLSAGTIILIVGAGGAFGTALQQTGIAEPIRNLIATYDVSVLLLAFLLTSLIRSAQGSSTVGMIAAAGTLAGVGDPSQLGFHPVYLALAIGCGSQPVLWMNDSGFWVISQMSGLTVKEALTTVTPLTTVVGLSGLLTTMLAAHFFPLV